MPTAPFDSAFVRRHFPGLDAGWTLFDNAGGSVPLRGVIDRIGEHLTHYSVQLGASYELSVRAAERVEAGRRAMAKLVGAEPSEIVMGASTTASMNGLARALEPRIRAGARADGGAEIIVTDLDHDTNIAPWERLAERTGATLKVWRLRPESMTLDVRDLEALLTERTRLLAMTHCSNLAGEILDVARAASVAKAAGALVAVDGVAYAPHRRIDVRALGCDFYGFSTYKTYGPHLGVLWGRAELLESLPGQNHPFVTALPSKLEPGGTNYELMSALPAVPDYLLDLEARHAVDPSPADPDASDESRRLDRAFELIAAHEEQLAARLLDFLRGHPKVTVRGPATADRTRRVPTISFTVDGTRSADVPPRLDREKLAVRWGHFYAPRAVRALGLSDDDGVIRVSMVHYNTLDEVDRLVDALDRVL
ncbi:MAG: cysteine desulfurase-like protein [Acidobacteriota bacterium]